MTRYAKQTEVSAMKSRNELEALLMRYSATGFMYGWHGNSATIAFVMRERQVKFVLPFPDRQAREITHSPEGKSRIQATQDSFYDQAIRQRWRALVLIVKAKLEAIETGIVDFESEFLSNVVLPDGQTAGEFMKPQIKEAYRIGKMPHLLIGGPR